MTKLLVPRRPMGRLFLCLLALLVAAVAAHASGPQTTLVSDVVYRADGAPASGTLVISWPAFAAPSGEAIAAGTKTVKIGPAGAVSIPLVPNLGAEPTGTYYRVTYKLDDGSTSEEYWSLPVAPATTITAIRSKLVPANVAVQTVSRQYVDSALAAVVQTTGNQTIAGTKTFSDVHVPEPQGAPDAASKNYVDASIASAGPGGGGISPNPSGSQTIVQPAGTKFKVTGGNPAEFDAIITKAPVADVRAFGAVGDCVTNDGPAIQAAINSGRNVYLPKTRGSGQCDYLSNQTLSFSSKEQRIYGESGGSGASTIVKFASNTTGVRCPLNQKGGAALENLNLQGPDEWNGADLATFVVNGAARGVWDQCGGFRMENVFVNGFNGDGVYVDGTSVTTCNDQPCADMFSFHNVWAYKNRGWGFNLDGGDSNAGTCTACKASANQKGGVRDSSFLGNTWTGLWTDGNGFDATTPGVAVNISAVVRSGNMVTATTASPHGLLVGSRAYLINVTDSSFNSTTQGWPVLSVANPTTFTYANVGSDASSSGGSVAPKRGWEVWRAAGLTPTPLQCDDNAWGSVFLGTYVESNQPPLQIGQQCMMMWGDYLGAGVNWSKRPSLLHGSGNQFSSSGFTFKAHDAITGAEQDLSLGTASQCTSAGDILCTIDQNPASAPAGTKGNLALRKFVSGGSPWIGWRCCLDSDSAGFANYAMALAYGATTESGNTRPMAWLMNGTYEGFTGVSNRRVRHFQANGSAAIPSGVSVGDFYQNIANDAEPEAYGFVFNGSGYQWVPMGLQPGCGWKCPGAIGATAPNSGKFTSVQSTVATGTAPLVVASTTPVANLTLAADSQLPTIASTGKVAATALPDATLSAKGALLLARDLGGLAAAPTVAGIQGRNVASTAPADGDCYKWVAGSSEWRPGACAGGGGGGSAAGVYLTVAIHNIGNSPVAANSYYYGARFSGSGPGTATQANFDRLKMVVQKACTLKSYYFKLTKTGSETATTNPFTVALNLNNTTDLGSDSSINLGGSGTQEPNGAFVSGLNQAVNAGDGLALKVTAPGSGTMPTNVTALAIAYCE